MNFMLGSWNMRKLLAIIVLGLMWSEVSFALSQQSAINQFLSDRKLKPIEGIWADSDGVIEVYHESEGEIKAHRIRGGKAKSGAFQGAFYGSDGNYSGYSYISNPLGKLKCALTITLRNSKNGQWVCGAYDSTLTKIWPNDLRAHNAKFGGNTGGDSGISFTIADKKNQCEAIGFKPQTEKFADCVLKLVELDLKTQIKNPTIVSQSTGNQQIANELRRSNNLRSSQFLMDLSRDLLTPSAPAAMSNTKSCTVRGGTIKSITCW